MFAFSRQLLGIFRRPISVYLFPTRCHSVLFKTASLCAHGEVRPASRTCCGELSQPARPDLPQRYSTLNKTQCDVHKFGELRLTVGSSCEVTVSSLDPHVYLDQNLVIVDDTSSRLSVDCHSADGVSHVTVSEPKDKETNSSSSQQSDVCTVQVPIKYGNLACLYSFYRKVTGKSILLEKDYTSRTLQYKLASGHPCACFSSLH